MWQNRIIDSGEENPNALMANPGNWRIHPAYQQGAVQEVIERVGWVAPVIVNKRSGNVVDGHLRVTIAIRENEAAVPVQYVDLDEEEERLILATFDNLTAMAGKDQAKLDELLAEIEPSGESLSVLLDELQTSLDGAAFDPPGEGEGQPQGQLDQLNPKWVVCPHCGSEFDAANESGGKP
jgi:hypothetical protein